MFGWKQDIVKYADGSTKIVDPITGEESEIGGGAGEELKIVQFIWDDEIQNYTCDTSYSDLFDMIVNQSPKLVLDRGITNLVCTAINDGGIRYILCRRDPYFCFAGGAIGTEVIGLAGYAVRYYSDGTIDYYEYSYEF